MNRICQQVFGTATLGLMLALPISGCVARPAPRPSPVQQNGMTIDSALSMAVTKTAESVPGSGKAEAVVMGDLALITLDAANERPGGTEGESLIGDTQDPDATGTSAPSGPVVKHGPGGGLGTSPAMPGGGVNPGGATPGGTPNYTSAAPDGKGGRATVGGPAGAVAPTPGALGSAPLDLMTRVSNQVRTKHPAIAEVRFVTAPDDARVLMTAIQTIHGGGPVTVSPDLIRVAQNATPAGTARFSPMTPTQAEPDPSPGLR